MEHSNPSQPQFDPVYPASHLIDLSNPDSFLGGHPYETYDKLRSTAPEADG
jgi:hypothetical protein